ncbi:MAG: type II toxin-antitoxin system VapC family toxin [Thermoguttaceae bacterium]
MTESEDCETNQLPFWLPILNELQVIDVNEKVALETARIYQVLKPRNRIIEFFDMAIAATALAYQMLLATLNIEHFIHIESLEWVIP